MFTLASCLITSNLPWFMDLTFWFPMQYCSLQHWNLLSHQDTFTTGRLFCFGSISPFFLELFLHSSPVAYCGTYQPWEFIFQCHIFFPFHTVHGVLKARILKIGGDGGVEGCALIFSCENTKTTTSCWPTIDRRMLDAAQRRYPTSKGWWEAATRLYLGHNLS